MTVYYIHAPALRMVKIGFTDQPRFRLSKMQSDTPVPIVLLAMEEGDRELEAVRHSQFASLRRHGEWFAHEGDLAEHIAALGPVPELPRKVSLNKALIALGLSPSHASMILSGKREITWGLAVALFRATGWKHPKIQPLTDEQIAMLEQIEPWSPRPSKAEGQAA